MNSKNLSQVVVTALEDMKGQSISCIDVRELTSLADYMVIATGTSNTHVKALAHDVTKAIKDANIKLVGSEGRSHSEWVLVDAGDVIVHLMLAKARAAYKLEDLWDFSSRKAADDEAMNADSNE